MCLIQKFWVLLSRCRVHCMYRWHKSACSLETCWATKNTEGQARAWTCDCWVGSSMFSFRLFGTRWEQSRSLPSKSTRATTEAQLVVKYVFSGAHNSADYEPSHTERIWNTCNWHQLCIPNSTVNNSKLPDYYIPQVFLCRPTNHGDSGSVSGIQ